MSQANTSSTLAVPAVGSIPRHVAIIMDGNGRWATKRFMPRVAGHSEGLEAVRKVVEECVRQNVQYLTLFAFSSENWRRPPEEVGFLTRLFLKSLKKEVARLAENNIRLKMIGDLSRFGTAITLKATDLTESLLLPHLSMAYAPEPDLFIRTGGEQRVSNFLLWQLAYTELYFTDTLWPDFDATQLQKAFTWYAQRERRFGRTSAQLADELNVMPLSDAV